MNGLRLRHAEGLLSTVGDVGGDFATLAELQLKLAAVDAKEAAARASAPTAVMLVAGIVLVAAIPVVLIGLAFLLATWLGISQGASLLLTGLIFAAVAGTIAFIALRAFLKSFESFRRSREELDRNLNWIRTVLKQSTKSTSSSRS
jgi:uncharacterized membrane protein YqjE